MNQNVDKEMDLLLKQHARLSDGAAGRGADGGAHLDADELSAYAENALPPAARARYSMHLADCDQCRKIVADLASALNIAGALAQQTAYAQAASPSISWRARLAAIFAPRVLRFAVPVVTICLVGAVALITLRTQVEREYVALDRRAAEPAPAMAPDSALKESSSSTAAPDQTGRTDALPPLTKAAPDRAQSDAIDRLATAPGEKQARREPEAASKEQGPTATHTSAASSESTGPADSPRPTPAPDTKNQKAADQALLVDNEKKRTEEKKSEAGAETRVEPHSAALPSRQEQAPAGSRDEAASGAYARRPAAPEPARSREADDRRLARNTAPAREGEQRTDAARVEARRAQGAGDQDTAAGRSELRSAGGRRFRRQGNAWVDTAYNSSLTTINVKRGSEQYRALVADEPDLGRIADQFDSEVIIVWKGRAYRFR
jgi:anti-sigma factor ChrR (cupin superfamily)